MKGCLTVLVLAALFLFSGAWLAGPPVAGFLLETALTTGGLRSNDLEVTVDGEPRFELLGGHADRVRIRATAASYRELSIERLVVDMDDVGLVDRRADQVEGELEGVIVNGGPASGFRIPLIRLAGEDGQISATLQVDTADAAALFERRAREETGRDIGAVVLEAPDHLAFVVSGATVSGRLAIANGALVLRTDGPAALGEVVLVEADALPVTLRSVTVTGDRLELEGVLASGLLG